MGFFNRLGSLPPAMRPVERLLRLCWSGDSTRELTTKSIEADTIEAETVSLDTDPTVPAALAEGQSIWDPDNHTRKTGLRYGSSLLDGQELLEPTYNDTGAEITNGTAVFFSTPAGADEHLSIGLTRPDLFARVAGIVTSTHAIGGEGWTATYGVVHDMDITGLTLGQPAFADPLVPGGMTNTDPVWPDNIIFMGSVIKDNGDNTGDFRVDPYIVQREVPTPVCLSSYSGRPARDSVENIHGGLISLDTAHDLSAGDLVVTTGQGKILLVLNAGADAVGTITVTGTSVDRNTGAETPADTYDITVDGLTTDASAADTNGVLVYDLTDSYGTGKWFTGSVTISSLDTTITDMDTYHASYEQFNDARIILLDTADFNYLALGTAALSANLYTVVDGDGDKFTITSVAGNAIASHTADMMYRRRTSDLGIQLAGASDGVFVQVRWFGTNQFADAGIKVWADVIL